MQFSVLRHFLSLISSLLICISEVIDISPNNLDSSLCFFHPSISHDKMDLSYILLKLSIKAKTEDSFLLIEV